MGVWLVISLLAVQTPDYLDDGRKALDANRVEEAEALFQKAVADEPDDYAAHFHLALADALLHHDPAAITEYQRTLELKPHLYQAELNLGILFLRGKHAEDAATLLESAAGQKPAEFRPNYFLGEALLEAGKPSAAQPAFEAALKCNPQSSLAELGLARALLGQNQLAAAEPHFRAAAALPDASSKDALLELAEAFEKAGRAEDAIAVYKQFPANPAAQERLGELLIESKHFDEAIPRLEQAVSDSPTTANRLALATAYRMTSAFEKQNQQLAKAVSAEPANYELRMIYGRALRDERQLVPAADQFFAASKLKPDSKEAWNELASALIVHEDYAQGLAALDKVKALGAETPGSVYFRAITLDKIHQRPQAVENYKLFLQMSQGKFPDQEFMARQRIRIIETELHGR